MSISVRLLPFFLLPALPAEENVFAPPSRIDGVHPERWFDCNPGTRRNIQEDSSAEAALVQEWINRLQANPDDEEAYLALSEKEIHWKTIHAGMDAGCKAYSQLKRYRQLHHFPGNKEMTGKPSRSFVLKMRGLLDRSLKGEALQTSLHQWLEEDDSLSLLETAMLGQALSLWCGDSPCKHVKARQTLFYINSFRGRHINLSSKEAHDIASQPPCLERFVLTEAGIHGKPCAAIKDRPDWRNSVLAQLVWRYPEGAAALARSMHVTGFELLLCQEETLERYLRYKGITHYRTMGQETPECCITALTAHQFSSPEEAAALVKKQAASLEPELRALAPRCALACGQEDWSPVRITADEPSPAWPDVSAVSLPLWRDELLGAPAPKAFDEDLKALASYFAAVRERQSAGVILSSMMDECDRTRPELHDISTPVYLRMAQFFAEDGVSIDRSDRENRIHCARPATTDPVVAEALHKIPQYLHRLALSLAVLEKQGENLDEPCSRLAKELNRHNLWPLIICQRELRSFSPRALLTLFTHYEGERGPLPVYGEAMGLEHEMSIAAWGTEDDLGANLLRAGRISGAIPATDQEREEAVSFFMDMARRHASDESPRLTGDILQHLLRWGCWQSVADWQDCPVRFFQRHYAINGLRLIRQLQAAGRLDAARNILAMMKGDEATETTPSCRLAEALLTNNEQEAAALRTDALLLATLYRNVDFSLYETYLEELAVMGENPDCIIRSELIRSWGKSAGVTETMARRYEQLGDWEKATFAWEYLIATGISTATPYGHIPSQADIYRYKLSADACRARSQNKVSLPRPPEGKNALAALPTRSWALKDGRSIEGQLAGIYQNLGGIRLLLPDGTAQLVSLDSLAGDEENYFNEWRQANRLKFWADVYHKNMPKPVFSRLEGAEIDMLNPGHYYMRFLTEENSIRILSTLNMHNKDDRRKAIDYGKHHAQSDLLLAADPKTAKGLAEKHNLPILALSIGYNSNINGIQDLLAYMRYHPEASAIWKRQFILLVLAYPMEERKSAGKYPVEWGDALEAYEREWNPDAAGPSQARRILDKTNISRSSQLTCCWLGKGVTRCGYVNVDYLVPPEELFHKLSPLYDEEPRPMP